MLKCGNVEVWKCEKCGNVEMWKCGSVKV